MKSSSVNKYKFLLPGGLLLLVVINLWVHQSNVAFDLTSDKRFTLNAVTRDKVKSLDDKVVVKVFLEKDLNPGFRKLFNATDHLLGQMKKQNKTNFEVQFVNVEKLEGEELKAFNATVENHQMLPVNVVDEDNAGKITQKSVFPWALLQYKGKEFPVELLQNIPGRSGEQNLNASIENLEYVLMDAIRILTITQSERVAFIEGHGELNEDEVYDFTSGLSRYFSVDRGRIGTSVEVLKPYKCLIVADPRLPFSETEKFILDQYLMQGGKVLWFVNGVNISMDSLMRAPMTFGIANDAGVSDLLFHYGVRINPVLVADLQCARIPVNTAPAGSEPEYTPMPWVYSPLLNTSNLHPITKNISAVKAEFASVIDLVADREGVKKTVVMATGKQTKLMPVPVEVSLSQISDQQDMNEFNMSYQPVAVVLEGSFQSAYLNRLPPSDVQIRPDDILLKSASAKMMVVANGEIPKNEVQRVGNNQRIYPLGYDKVMGKVAYGNKDFVLNAVNYLTDETGMLTLRNRSIPMRLLDKEQANEKRYIWQIINLLIPIVLLFVLYSVNAFIRKRKFADKM